MEDEKMNVFDNENSVSDATSLDDLFFEEKTPVVPEITEFTSESDPVILDFDAEAASEVSEVTEFYYNPAEVSEAVAEPETTEVKPVYVPEEDSDEEPVKPVKKKAPANASKKGSNKKGLLYVALALVAALLIGVYFMFFAGSKCTVVFKEVDGTVIRTVTVRENKTIKDLSAPEKTGYTFSGWKLNGKEFTPETRVTKDIILVADYRERFDVTFMTDEKTEFTKVSVVDGDKLTKPESPKLENKSFVAWTLDGKDFDFDTPITKPITLLATFRDYYKATSIMFDRKQYTVEIGKPQTLKVEVKPDNATEPVTYTSSNPDVLTIDETGKATGVTEGKVVVTAEIEGIRTTCDVEVIRPFVTKIEIDPSEVIINVDSANTKVDLKVVVEPKEADQGVTFTSSDPSIADINANGTITAFKPGKCTIKGKAYGGLTANVLVNVVKNPDKIAFKETSVDVARGKTTQLEVEFTPKENVATKLTYTSDNTSVATVDKDGVVTGVGKGTCTITAKSEGGKEATVKVTVKVPVEKVEISYVGSNVLREKDNTVIFTAKIYPEDADVQDVTWDCAADLNGPNAQFRNDGEGGHNTLTLKFYNSQSYTTGLSQLNVSATADGVKSNNVVVYGEPKLQVRDQTYSYLTNGVSIHVGKDVDFEFVANVPGTFSGTYTSVDSSMLEYTVDKTTFRGHTSTSAKQTGFALHFTSDAGQTFDITVSFDGM